MRAVCISSCDLNHSDKFVIRETFDEVKNLTFEYNIYIIRK
jgi:hypothetical protein